MTSTEVQSLNARFSAAPAEELLRWAWERFGPRAALGTSFQGAGLVILHLAKTRGFEFPVFTLDPGLLFPETIALKRRLEAHFGLSIQSLVPDLTVEEQEEAHGPELWKRDPDLCCTLRKVLPLQDRLATLDCWITGLRREHSHTRAGIELLEVHAFEQTADREILKLNPLANWQGQEIWRYIRTHGIPYNPLHDRGYRSIGCRPCTAPAGEAGGERAGRWVGFNKTECGIHTFLAKRT
jgi:phosphoadenosine phosphosulfate reductase